MCHKSIFAPLSFNSLPSDSVLSIEAAAGNMGSNNILIAKRALTLLAGYSHLTNFETMIKDVRLPPLPGAGT